MGEAHGADSHRIFKPLFRSKHKITDQLHDRHVEFPENLTIFSRSDQTAHEKIEDDIGTKLPGPEKTIPGIESIAIRRRFLHTVAEHAERDNPLCFKLPDQGIDVGVIPLGKLTVVHDDSSHRRTGSQTVFPFKPVSIGQGVGKTVFGIGMVDSRT